MRTIVSSWVIENWYHDFYFSFPLLFWCLPDLAETWHTKMKYWQNMCFWSLSKEHQKRKCQKFPKKACFREISCLPYISTCPNSSDNLQLNSRLLHSDWNQAASSWAEVYPFDDGYNLRTPIFLKRHVNQKGHWIPTFWAWVFMNSSQPPYSGTWYRVSGHPSSPKHLIVCIYTFHSPLVSDKNFQ